MALIGIPSTRCNRRISAQSSTFSTPHDRGEGSRFDRRQGVSLHPSPTAAIKVELGKDADLIGVRGRLVQWYWCGILGELYGSAIETRFVRDLEQVPAWAHQHADAAVPKTVQEASFVESRLHSLRTRGAAAY